MTVKLYELHLGAMLATTYTDAQGGYLFDNLAAGTYYVDVDESTLPAGHDADALQRCRGPTSATRTCRRVERHYGYPVALPPGGENLTADFGYNYNPTVCVDGRSGRTETPPTAALGDRVWIDADGDGVQDPEEAGIAGVPVTLYYDPDGDGVFGTPTIRRRRRTTTDATGNYLFDNLPPGAYVVVRDAAGGLHADGRPRPLRHERRHQRQPDDDAGGPGAGGRVPECGLRLPAGGRQPEQQHRRQGVVRCGRRRRGPDGNGLPGDDDSEAGIPGVTVALIKDVNGNGTWDAGEPIVATDTTDANGDYLFPGLPDGNYLVWVNDTDNVLGAKTPTYDANGGAAPTGSGAPTGVASSTVLGLSASALDPTSTDSSSVNDQTQDFGYTAPGQNPGEGLIGDRVWLDINSDGVQDARRAGSGRPDGDAQGWQRQHRSPRRPPTRTATTTSVGCRLARTPWW